MFKFIWFSPFIHEAHYIGIIAGVFKAFVDLGFWILNAGWPLLEKHLLLCLWLERWIQQFVNRIILFFILICWYQILFIGLATAIWVDGACSNIMSVFIATSAIQLGIGTIKCWYSLFACGFAPELGITSQQINQVHPLLLWSSTYFDNAWGLLNRMLSRSVLLGTLSGIEVCKVKKVITIFFN